MKRPQSGLFFSGERKRELANWLAKTYREMGNYPSAREYYRRALELNPGSSKYRRAYLEMQPSSDDER